MPSYIERNTALAQAALDHALYFLELGANDKAAAYYHFASQQLQGVVKNLMQQEAICSVKNRSFQTDCEVVIAFPQEDSPKPDSCN